MTPWKQRPQYSRQWFTFAALSMFVMLPCKIHVGRTSCCDRQQKITANCFLNLQSDEEDETAEDQTDYDADGLLTTPLSNLTSLRVIPSGATEASGKHGQLLPPPPKRPLEPKSTQSTQEGQNELDVHATNGLHPADANNRAESGGIGYHQGLTLDERCRCHRYRFLPSLYQRLLFRTCSG